MNNALARAVRVRFAPSPTGHLHVGGVRAAIFNWLFARHHQGTYLLRIEDTDYERSKQEYTDSILSSLSWLSLLPDEPVVIQSSRIEEHKRAAYDLIEKARAYRCICDPQDAKEKIAELEEGIASLYPGTCRTKNYTARDVAGRPYAIRFHVPRHKEFFVFNDLIRGKISFPIEQIDDFVIVRRDGTPTYNFVVVIDDIFMNISHIVRGEDHISNTPKQIMLYEAFGAEVPLFGHLPLILGPSGNRLSKRDAAVSVEEYRSMGILADALYNYLVRLGWSHGDQEVFTKEELISFFTLDKIGKKGSIFDSKKLLWLNGVYLRAATTNELLNAIGNISTSALQELKELWTSEELEVLIMQYKQRASDVMSMANDIKKLAAVPETLDLTLLAKWLTPSTDAMLRDFNKELGGMQLLNHDALLAAAQKIVDSGGQKLVALAQALRLAITGSIQSPGIFELIAVIGKQRAQKRITLLIDALEKTK